MLDYLFGLLLFGLGLGNRPTVLGEQATSSAKPVAQLKLMRPKFTAEEQEAFQKERAKRDANLKRIGEARLKEMQKTFAEKQAARASQDQTAKEVLEEKVNAFKDSQKRQKLLSLSTKFESAVTNQLESMQKKLESMSTLLDRLNAATGALKTQGVDVSAIESEISSAQAKVTSALGHVSALVSSLPTAFSVSSEESAKEDVLEAIENVKTQLEPVRESLKDAHEAVGVALSHVESQTDAVQVGVWPERK